MDEANPMSSPMKAMGVGELGLCGVANAIPPLTVDERCGGLHDLRNSIQKSVSKLGILGLFPNWERAK